MPRSFSLDEATALLPRLESILLGLQEQKRTIDRLQQQIGALSGRASGDGHLLAKELSDKRREAEALSGEVSKRLEEITSLGCELKGIDEGLIDFQHERNGRTVYLCWKLGEQRIEWWHELDTEFADRQRL